jgi:hypothetical protein
MTDATNPRRAMSVAESKQVKGTRVCVIGRGADNLVHQHTVIDRVTKTLLITKGGRRFSRHTFRSAPSQEYGGTRIFDTCQRPKKVSDGQDN